MVTKTKMKMLPYLRLCEKVVDRMRSVLDGAPWSYISPFLDLSDTFLNEVRGHYLEYCSKYPTLTENSCL